MGFGVKFQGEKDPEPGQNIKSFSVMNQWQNGVYYTVWPQRYAERKAILVPLPAWQDRN
jgi:hypothetical protein